MLKLGGVSQATLEAYSNRIESLAALWPRAWHLILESDDRMMSEGLDRIRRITLIEIDAGEDPPKKRGWDVAKLWSFCFYKAAADKYYWEDHVKAPAAAWVAAGDK